MTRHRSDFFALLEGKKTGHMQFYPDITDWYVANRMPQGAARPFGPGEFIPDDAPMHKLPGSIPEKYRNFTLFDFYREFNWGFHVHIENWRKFVFSGGIQHLTSMENGKRMHQLITPKGTLTRRDLLAGDGSWCRSEFYIKEIKDLEIMRYVVENTHFEPCFENVERIMQAMGEWGQGDIVISRSPFGKLVHEYMGFEQLTYAMADAPDEILEFVAMQEKKDLELIELAAKTPERLIIISDHADENLISPPQWREYCCPFYRKANDILHRSGKLVSTHLDGNFKGYFPDLNESGFDLLDGCTPAPMFNYEVEELADALPENMYAFCGVPSTLFCQKLPTDTILRFGDRIVSLLKGKAILNVGDILPPDGDIEQVIALGKHLESQ